MSSLSQICRVPWGNIAPLSSDNSVLVLGKLVSIIDAVTSVTTEDKLDPVVFSNDLIAGYQNATTLAFGHLIHFSIHPNLRMGWGGIGTGLVVTWMGK
jgi:hypothetical protein